MLGVCGLYNDGWMLSAKPIRAPWELTGAAIADPAAAYDLELYELGNDWKSGGAHSELEAAA